MPRFCQGATGVALVFDVTVPESLDASKKWLEFITSWNTAQHDFSIVLVGNKTDLHPNIPIETIQTFCIKHQIAEYIPCSAKSGKNVKRVFQSLCSAMQRNQHGITEHAPSIVHSPT